MKKDGPLIVACVLLALAVVTFAVGAKAQPPGQDAKRLVVFGDSISCWHSNWTYHLQGDWNVQNHCQGGRRFMWYRFPADIYSWGTARAVIYLGSNDRTTIQNEKQRNVYRAKLVDTIQNLKRQGFKRILVVNIPHYPGALKVGAGSRHNPHRHT